MENSFTVTAGGQAACRFRACPGQIKYFGKSPLANTGVMSFRQHVMPWIAGGFLCLVLWADFLSEVQKCRDVKVQRTDAKAQYRGGSV
ncbi:hypothetical protein D3Z51_12155 [Clostridiaceae bacterium]|nr:hypothetical protein [Clostridiaceae bacterium]RKI12404.1 hypothetical protein D7V81_11910 [bacterium 1XD21-70]